MNNAMKMYFAEFLGTATLVLVGCGSIAIGGLGAALGSGPIGALALLPIGLTFGMTVTALAYGIGPVSGCHVNPAVSVGAWVAGRLDTQTLIGYVIAQFLGGVLGAAILWAVLGGSSSGLGVTTVQEGFSMGTGFLVEFIATFLFLIVILGATNGKASTPVAGLAIGLALTVLHLAFIKVAGNSVNPARSFGPAIFVGGKSLSDLWIYLVAPTIGGALAGFLFKIKALEV